MPVRQPLSGFELVADGRTPHRAALRHLFQLCLIGLQNSSIELFPELLCDRVGHIPIAAFAVRLAGHPKKEALAALYDFQIFHHKAVIEFHAGKAHQIFHRFDDPHAYIQLYRGGWCSARSFSCMDFSFPLRVSMARSLLMAAEDGFCKTACFE